MIRFEAQKLFYTFRRSPENDDDDDARKRRHRHRRRGRRKEGIALQTLLKTLPIWLLTLSLKDILSTDHFVK